MKFFKEIVIIVALLITSIASSQDLVIGDAANLEISPGANLIFSNGMNLVNNSSSVALNGTFVFRGSLPQEISGSQPLTLANLNIEEGAFVSLTNNVNISETLNLTGGMVNLLNNSLKVLNGATINGAFSETAMIVAEGTGKLEMEIESDGTYLFPVGDTSDIDEYSPAQFSFWGGDYSNAVLSVSLKNKKHLNNSSSSNYLNRYWVVTQTGISNINCDIVLKYTNDDVVGTESNMIGAVWNGDWWLPINEGLSLNSIEAPVYGFGEFTGGEQEVLSTDNLQSDDVEVLINGKNVILKSTNNFLLKKVEVYNKLGQAVQMITPANALYHEFNITGKSDIYLLRLTSNSNSIVKKVFID